MGKEAPREDGTTFQGITYTFQGIIYNFNQLVFHGAVSTVGRILERGNQRVKVGVALITTLNDPL